MPNPEEEMIQPALKGTRNVLNACVKAKVKRVVVVSSVSAVMVKPKWPNDQEMDEECWSDVELCKEVQVSWFCISSSSSFAYRLSCNHFNMMQELLLAGQNNGGTRSLGVCKENELNIITVCPSIIIGPKLQHAINSSSLFLLRLLTDGPEEVQDATSLIVDVRDTAEALLLVYEKPEAEGRYICTSYRRKMRALAEKLRHMYPNYSSSRKMIDPKMEPYPISSKKLQDLGWKFRPLEETIADSVKEYQESGILGQN